MIERWCDMEDVKRDLMIAIIMTFKLIRRITKRLRVLPIIARYFTVIIASSKSPRCDMLGVRKVYH